MAWTPPSKFTVIISFLICIFGIFILYDVAFLAPDYILPEFTIGDYNRAETWVIIAMIVLFLAWFLMFLGVRLKGL
ncbi:MAG: hypothetical protein ACFFA6_11295 [Promethearchaeota archaeon]